MDRLSHAPLAVRMGATHVSIAQVADGDWVVMAWSQDSGRPRMVSMPRPYQEATERARGYCATLPGAVLDLPKSFGMIHVYRNATGYEVLHEGSAGSFGNLGNFGPDDRDAAVAHALSRLGVYAPCRLGAVDP